MIERFIQLLVEGSVFTAWGPGCPELALANAPSQQPLKVVLVVAHPDDESECAGMLYRISHELGGIVDQVIVTNGEGGSGFAAPAASYYGFCSTKEMSSRLPRLRKREALGAGRVLGIRRHYFLEQRDPGFTLDPEEAFRCWDADRVRRQLQELFQREQYDLVLILLPSQDTHGHHKTVAVLALEAAAGLPFDEQPAVAGVRTSSLRDRPTRFNGLPGYPVTATTTSEPLFAIDRRAALAQNVALDYTIVVHWVIAEHKSQGLFQMEYGKHTHEQFWPFAVGRHRWESVLPWLQNLGIETRHPAVEAA